MSKTTIVDVLISTIKEDQMLLNVLEAKIEEAKNEKQVIVNRLKEQHRDLATLSKYADGTQQEKIKELGLVISEPQKSVNTVAVVAFDLIVKAKGNQLTNGALYDAYVKSVPKTEEVLKYSAFNIKCRTLFNTQKLIRTKGKDPKSSREDIISLNGRGNPAVGQESNDVGKIEKKDDKSTATTK